MSMTDHDLWYTTLNPFCQRLLVTQPGSLKWPHDLWIPANSMTLYGPIALPTEKNRSDTFGLWSTHPFYVGGICDKNALVRCFFSPALNGYIKESKIMGVNGKGLSVVRLEDAEWRVSRDAEADWLKEEFNIVDRDAP